MIAGGLALTHWIQRSSWFSKLIAAQVYIVVGAVVTSLLMYFISGMAYSAEAPYARLGFVIGFGFIALFFVGVDAVLVARVRAMSRRVRQLPQERTSSPLE
jgi:hypothetical protein